MNYYDILIAGVGGQGTILSSRLIGAAAILNGDYARTGETIGMSQRGGCVVSHIRIGSEDKSSYVPMKNADLLIGFELAETARNLGRLKENGFCIVNTQKVKPVPVSLGIQKYNDDEIIDYIKTNTENALFIDGYQIAKEVGSVKAVNVVLLGACCGAGFLPIDKEVLLKAVKENVPSRFIELNEKAFEAGYSFAKGKK